MSFCTRLVFVAVALLTAPIASHGQRCPLPTKEDVERVGGGYLTTLDTEGAMSVDMTVHNMNFTCLARVAFDEYTFASVVVNATSSAEPTVTEVYQFQLQCNPATNQWDEHASNLFDSNVPPDPFNIETDFRCWECVEAFPPNTFNYDNITNCRSCDSACESFCTGAGSQNCCPGFDSDSGECVDCTTIDPNFGPNEDFVCACQISCDAGNTANFTDCSCELSDGCEAAGQPCQNGSTCTSDLSMDPFYICMCAPGFTGEDCSSFVPTVAITHPTSATTAEIPVCDGCEEDLCDSQGCCSQCRDQYMLADDNCTCVEVPTTEPTRSTEPTGVCPATCRDCSPEDPTCCTVCLDGYVLVRPCECAEDEGERSLAAEQVAGIAIGLLLFILLILALAVLLAYVIYYFYDNKQKLKKGTALSPFSNGESHSNPLYLTPEEVEVED